MAPARAIPHVTRNVAAQDGRIDARTRALADRATKVAAPHWVSAEQAIEVASGRSRVAELPGRLPGRDASLPVGPCRVATTDTLVPAETGVVASRKSQLSGVDGPVANREGSVR